VRKGTTCSRRRCVATADNKSGATENQVTRAPKPTPAANGATAVNAGTGTGTGNNAAGATNPAGGPASGNTGTAAAGNTPATGGNNAAGGNKAAAGGADGGATKNPASKDDNAYIVFPSGYKLPLAAIRGYAENGWWGMATHAKGAKDVVLTKADLAAAVSYHEKLYGPGTAAAMTNEALVRALWKGASGYNLGTVDGFKAFSAQKELQGVLPGPAQPAQGG